MGRMENPPARGNEVQAERRAERRRGLPRSGGEGMSRTGFLCLAVLLAVGLATPAASWATSSGSAAPQSFHAQAMSWVSPEQGWMLGAARCEGGMCATVVGTTDG